jgi:hypothetical protein
MKKCDETPGKPASLSERFARGDLFAEPCSSRDILKHLCSRWGLPHSHCPSDGENDTIQPAATFLISRKLLLQIPIHASWPKSTPAKSIFKFLINYLKCCKNSITC